jgi:hypothetical protein
MNLEQAPVFVPLGQLFNPILKRFVLLLNGYWLFYRIAT